MRAVLIAGVAVAFAIACSSGGGTHHKSTKKDLTPVESGDMADPEGQFDFKTPSFDLKGNIDFTSTNSGPVISSFLASPSTAYDGESIVLQAYVSHPIGLDYISTVEVQDNSGYSYGNMSAAGSGSYSINLAWSTISTVNTLTFSSSYSRTFKVVVTDYDSKQKSQTTSVSFACSSGLGCTNGVCNTSSGTGSMTSCSTLPLATATCSDICSNLGQTCLASGCGGFTAAVHYNACSSAATNSSITCSAAISTAGYAPSYGDGIQCCCGL